MIGMKTLLVASAVSAFAMIGASETQAATYTLDFDSAIPDTLSRSGQPRDRQRKLPCGPMPGSEHRWRGDADGGPGVHVLGFLVLVPASGQHG